MTTTSGSDFSNQTLNRWRTRLDDRLKVERDLPWRNTRDPWSILVSEVMLQQTQVSRVLVAWPRFLAQFPDPAACAAAGQASVVRAWEGMGYHRRAGALFRCAAELCSRFDGEVPASELALRSLPGIGIYTARAILAFGFEQDVGVVDTNVARILARCVAGQALTARTAQQLPDSLVSPGHGWSHNQAMLDFGALRCKASPVCDGCPLRRSCRWAQRGFALPDPATKTAGTARPQARFEGSNRQIRGKILALARATNNVSEPLAALREAYGTERVEQLIQTLVDEGLVKRVNTTVVLA